MTATPTGVKEDLVLTGPDAGTVYEFGLGVEGLSAVEAGGGVHFLDSEGVVVAGIPAGFMTDAAGAFSDGVDMSLTGQGAERVLRVEVDPGWVSDPARVFPVVVDPTVSLNTGLVDTHVESARPSTNFSGYSFLRTGLQSSGNRSRALLKFDVSELNGKTIDYAQVRVFNEVSLTCAPSEVAVYRISQAWSASTVGWPGPSVAEKAGSVSSALGGPSCDPGWVNIFTNDLVRDWTSGAVANHGLSIRTSETSTNGYRQFTSAEGPVAQRPYLLVSWREPLLGDLGYYTLNSEQLTDRAQVHVNVANGNLMVQAVDVALPGVAGMGLNIGRYYNSREDTVNPARAGIPGAGWGLDVGRDVRFSVSAPGQSGYFEGPSGYRVVFPWNPATGTFDKPVGLNATATESPAGSGDYTVELHETGMRYFFTNGPAVDAVEDQRGNRISMTYGAGERVSSITDTKGGVTRFTYAANNKVATITDPDGRIASYGYDGLDLVSTTDFAGKTTRYGYDTAHNLTSLTDPRGGVTRFAYDSSDRLVSITWADSTPARPVVTTYEYTQRSGGRGWIVDMTDPNGNVNPELDAWTHVFDDQGRLETFYSPRSGVGEDYAYDAFNSVTTYTNNNGGIGTLTYDGYNVASIQSDSGATSTFEYTDPNSANRPSKFTDSKGVALSYQYNNDQEMTRVTGPDGIKARMAYRTASQSCTGSLASATDGNGNVTTYSYDSRCNMTRVDRPAPLGDTTMTYDAFDRVAQVTDGVGNRQVLSYDALDRVTRVLYYTPTGQVAAGDVRYTYDANGNRLTRSDRDGATTKTSTYTLDARNRLTGEVLPNVTNAYTYDRAGNLATMTTPWGTTTYTYGKENDVATITPPVGEAITFDYYEHTYAAVKFPNGVTDAQHYDTDGRIDLIDQYFYDGPGNVYRQLARLEHSYTNPATGAGTESIYSITDDDYNVQIDYTYDTNGRIKTSDGVSEGDIFEDNTYTYDNNSNRTAWTEGSRGVVTSYTAQYNAANQMSSMTRAGGPTTTFGYDANGSLTSDSAGTAISYDVRNRATSTTHRYAGSLGPQVSTYDGTSQVERTRHGATTFTNSVLGVTSTTEAAGTKHYVRAPDGRVLAEYRPGGQWRYYLTDRLGSITGATDTDGWRTESYGYDAYGNYTYGSGGGSLGLIQWRYTGAWLDGTSVTGSGFYKIGLRNYDDQFGRWTQTDPLERATNPTQPAEANPYNYVGCDPVNRTDPSGAFWGCFWGYVGLGASGVGVVGGAIAAPFSGPAAGLSVLMVRASYVGAVASVGGLTAGGCFPWQ